MSKPIKVASFLVDHETLKAGLYLRDTVRVGINRVKVWDLRFYAPSAHKYISPAASHTIEHILAYKLREYLPHTYVQTFMYGCQTGGALITRGSASYKDVRSAIIDSILDVLPIIDKSEIPALTTKECGQPELYDTKAASDALYEYCNVLLKEDYR